MDAREPDEGADVGVGEAGQLSRGSTVGRYLVTGLIGKGGMAEVWSGTNERTGKRIALKAILRQRTAQCRRATEHSQLLVTTHSPFFLNSARPDEVRILYRDEQGYTQARRAADVQGVKEFVREGATMGHLWLEGRFGAGDPLVNAGAPQQRGRKP